MSLSVAVDAISILDGIPPSSIDAAQRADLGQAAFGGFDVEDPAATLTITGHRPVTISESDCSQPRLFTGWTTTREVGRDKDAGMLVSGQRLHDVTIVDLNALFGFRQIRGSDAKRPAETWSARLTWLLGSACLTGLIADTGYVATSTRAMEAADYRGQYASTVCSDLVDRLLLSNYTFFAFWDPVAAAVGLYFDQIDAANLLSTLRISNVLSDVDSAITFEPNGKAKLTRAPDETYSEVTVDYGHSGKRVFRSRPSTAGAHIQRGTTIRRPYTGEYATAVTQAQKFLDQHAGELDTITATIIVPAASAGLVWAGQRMSVKFSHLPGYTTFTSMRVITCTATPTDDTARYYALALELAVPRTSGGGAACSYVAPDGPDNPSSIDVLGGQVGYLPDNYTPASPVYASTSTLVAGTGVVLFGTPNNGAVWGITPTVVGAQTISARWSWDLLALGSPSICTAGVRGGAGSADNLFVQVSDDGITWTTLRDVANVGGEDYEVFSVTDGSHRYWAVYYTRVHGGGYYEGPDIKWFMLWANTDTIVDLGPGPGTTVPSSTPTPVPDGTTVLFTLATPYVAGTLIVYVDGIPIPASEVTETDPIAGTFTLSWAPDADEVIRVLYIVG